MKKQAPSREIEDVLSSIRRLVSEDMRGSAGEGSLAPSQTAALVLTPQQRVPEGDNGETAGALRLDEPLLLPEVTRDESQDAELRDAAWDEPPDLGDLSGRPAGDDTTDDGAGEAPLAGRSGPDIGSDEAGDHAERAADAEAPDDLPSWSSADGPVAMRAVSETSSEPVAGAERDAGAGQPGASGGTAEIPVAGDTGRKAPAEEDAPETVGADASEADISDPEEGVGDREGAGADEGMSALIADLAQSLEDSGHDASSDPRASSAAQDAPIPPDDDPEASVTAAALHALHGHASQKARASHALEDKIAELEAMISQVEDRQDQISRRPEGDTIAGPWPARPAATSPSSFDEDALRALIAEVVREELQGALGERITRNVRKLVRREIQRILAAQDFD